MRDSSAWQFDFKIRLIDYHSLLPQISSRYLSRCLSMPVLSASASPSQRTETLTFHIQRGSSEL